MTAQPNPGLPKPGSLSPLAVEQVDLERHGAPTGRDAFRRPV
jgi:hypothetical protein